MWSITLRDLQVRRRRFAITILGAALVFAMALVLSGMSQGFRAEARNTLAGIGADGWVLPEGASGPFTSFATIPEAVAADVARLPGVGRADPLAMFREAFRLDGRLRDVFVIGHRPGGIGTPPVVEGRAVSGEGEVVVDEGLGLEAGDALALRGARFRIVGLVEGMSVLAGTPNVYLTLEDAQGLAFAGQPVATAVVTRGVPRRAPPGFAVLPDAEAEPDLLHPVENGMRSIDNARILLWLVATCIIGAVVYLSALERMRDFAVLKAIGASSRDLFAGLAVQAVVVSVLAALVASLLANVLAPLFPMPVVITGAAYLLLPALAVSVGLVASLAGLRRAVTVDPALAFGGP